MGITRATHLPRMAIDLEMIVLVAFDELEGLPSERSPWIERYDIDRSVELTGCPTPVYVNDRGLAVVTTGIGKTAAAVSTAALLASDRFNHDDARFLTVGVAGGPPDSVEIGSVVIATSIVDWDAKLRWDGDEQPIAINPYLDEPSAFSLEESLVDEASRAASEVRPPVHLGTNVCGDELWHGATTARQVEWLVDRLGCDPYLATQMEDAGTTCALARFDCLDRYLSLRGIANYDRPTDGTSPREHLLSDDFEAGFERGLTSAIEVASAVVDTHL